MKAARIQRFGPANLITIDDLPRPEAGAGELLVRVKAAGVGHWDALIREGKVKGEPLPLILGSELSGIVEAIGTEASGFKTGDEVYGATNEHFTGGYPEYALPFARRIPKTEKLELHRHVTAGQTVMIHGAAGNVGAYAVQLAKQAGLHVIATAGSRGSTKHYGIRAAYFCVDVTTERLNNLAELFDKGKLVTDVGTVLPLEKARTAHDMLGGDATQARQDRAAHCSLTVVQQKDIMSPERYFSAWFLLGLASRQSRANRPRPHQQNRKRYLSSRYTIVETLRNVVAELGKKEGPSDTSTSRTSFC